MSLIRKSVIQNRITQHKRGTSNTSKQFLDTGWFNSFARVPDGTQENTLLMRFTGLLIKVIIQKQIGRRDAQGRECAKCTEIPCSLHSHLSPQISTWSLTSPNPILQSYLYRASIEVSLHRHDWWKYWPLKLNQPQVPLFLPGGRGGGTVTSKPLSW